MANISRQQDKQLKKKTKPQATWKYMDVSKNRGTPKWMVYNGKLYQNGWFGGTICGNTHITASQTTTVAPHGPWIAKLQCWHSAARQERHRLHRLRVMWPVAKSPETSSAKCIGRRTRSSNNNDNNNNNTSISSITISPEYSAISEIPGLHRTNRTLKGKHLDKWNRRSATIYQYEKKNLECENYPHIIHN